MVGFFFFEDLKEPPFVVRSSGLESCQDGGLIGIKRKQNSNMTNVHIFENIFFLFLIKVHWLGKLNLFAGNMARRHGQRICPQDT